MTSPRSVPPRRARWRTILLSLGIGFLLVVVLLAAAVALLPTLLSSLPVQELLRPRLAAAIGRSVEWEKLELSWREGVHLSGLRVGKGGAPLRLLRIEDLQTSFGIARSELMPAQLFLNVRISGLEAMVEPAAAAATVPEKPAAAPEELLGNIAAQLQKALGLGWELPVDLRVLLDIGPATVRFSDPGTGETATVQDLYLTARLPSLLSHPIAITSTAELALNGHPLPPFRFATGISRLATLDGRLRPAGARIDLEIDFPGGHGQIQGTLAGAGLSGGIRLQPSQLLPLLQPFLPRPLPQVSGTLTATLKSTIADGGDLRLHLGLQGDSLTATGGPLAQRRAGPLSFTMTQQVLTDHRRDTVAFEAGQLRIPEMLEAHWQAVVEHPRSPCQRLTANLGPLILHGQPLLAFGKPFLPADLPLAALAGRLECDALAFSTTGNGERGVLSLRGLRLLFDRLAARSPTAEIAGRDLRLEVSSAEMPLVAGFPTAARMHLAWHLGVLRVGGKTLLELAGFPGQADLTVTDIRRSPASRFGLAAKMALNQQLSLATLRLSDMELRRIDEKLRVDITADPHGVVHADVQSLAFAAQGRPTVAGKSLAPFSAALKLQGAKVLLAEALPQIEEARLRLDFDPGLQLETLLELVPEAPAKVHTEGRLSIDAGALSSWLKPLLPPEFSAAGSADLAWRVAARLPEAGFPDPAAGNPLQQVREALDLLTTAELTLNIRNGAISLGKLSPVAASGINMPTPLHLSLRDGAQLASFDMVGTVERLTGLPGAAAGFPPQRVRLSVQGEERNLATVRLAEELRVEPAGLVQIAELVAEKIDRLAELPDTPTAADLLRRLDATLFATLDLQLPEELPAGAPPMQLAGALAAGLRVDLEGGKHLRVGAFGDLNDFDLRLPDGPEVDDLNLRLVFNRLYTIGDRQKALPAHPWLSETVLAGNPSAPAMAAPLVTERLWQDLRGVSGRERSLTFGRARAQVAGFPLELSAGEGALQLNGPNPGINYLQTGLLGGSLKARAGLDLAAAVPRVELLCSFSHLDTARLLPENVAPVTGAASEITGELALQLPLLDNSRQLLEKLDLRLHLWQIGSRTLERTLFALDPYEENETIIEQRKMLRHGNLKQLRITAADGSLSTAGEIEVRGLSLALPRIDRLNLASLPLEAKLAEPLKSLPPLLSLLDLAAANYLEIGADGAIALRRTQTGESP